MNDISEDYGDERQKRCQLACITRDRYLKFCLNNRLTCVDLKPPDEDLCDISQLKIRLASDSSPISMYVSRA